MSVKIKQGKNLLRPILERLAAISESSVTVGIHSDADGDVLKYATVQEFGATIHTGGGTAYGYKTKKDAIAGKSRFLKHGKGYMQTGVTTAHDIVIPERPFIRQTFDKHIDEIKEHGLMLAGEVRDGKITKKQGLQFWGDFLQQKIQDEINEGTNFTPNADSTIKKKGEGLHPLQGEGRLQQSIKAVVN